MSDLARNQDARQFEMSIDIAASPDLVWEAIANDVELGRWFAPRVAVTPGVGGTVSWTWEKHHHWPQTIEVWEPGARLKTRYDSPVDDGQGGKLPLFMDFTLQGSGGKTTLRLVHHGFGPEADFDNEFDGISHGWPVELRALKLYVERHFGQDRQLAWSTFDYPGSADEAWRKLTGEEGFRCGASVDELAVGDAFDFTSADGDHFTGEALQCFPREFTARASSHHDSFLRFSVYDFPGMKQIWGWLSGYECDPAEVAALQARWDVMLARLFPQGAAKESVTS